MSDNRTRDERLWDELQAGAPVQHVRDQAMDSYAAGKREAIRNRPILKLRLS